jgi:hypothetical protein
VRTIWRQRDRLVKEAGRDVQQMQKALTTMNVQLANAISYVSGVTGQAIIRRFWRGSEMRGTWLSCAIDGSRPARRRSHTAWREIGARTYDSSCSKLLAPMISTKSKSLPAMCNCGSTCPGCRFGAARSRAEAKAEAPKKQRKHKLQKNVSFRQLTG